MSTERAFEKFYWENKVKTELRYDSMINEKYKVYLTKLIEKVNSDLKGKKKEKEDRLILHSKFVMNISNEILGNLVKINENYEEIINLSSLLHDICKYENNEEHNILGAELIQDIANEKNFELLKKNEDMVSDIIRYHKEGKIKDLKDDKRLLLCKIVHDADKISKIFKDKSWKNNKDKYKKIIIYNTLNEIANKIQLGESKIILNKYEEEINFYIAKNKE